METKKILVIEGEKFILDIVCFQLKKEGFEAIVARNGSEGLELAFSTDPDLIIIGTSYPGMSGFEVCKTIREHSNIPIIILTSKENPEDIVYAFEIGADDYIKQPFGCSELIARIKANIRRAAMPAWPEIQR